MSELTDSCITALVLKKTILVDIMKENNNVDDRKYKIILHNQTVRINRSLYYSTSSEEDSTSWNYGQKTIMN